MTCGAGANDGGPASCHPQSLTGGRKRNAKKGTGSERPLEIQRILGVPHERVGTSRSASWLRPSNRQHKEGETNLDQLVLWIIVGGVAGLLADAVVKGPRLRLVGAVVVGIIGGFIGGWLFGLLGISAGGSLLGDIIVSFIGAVVLLVLLRAIRRWQPVPEQVTPGLSMAGHSQAGQQLYGAARPAAHDYLWPSWLWLAGSAHLELDRTRWGTGYADSD